MKNLHKFLFVVIVGTLSSCNWWVGRQNKQDGCMIYTFCGAPGSGKGTLAEKCVNLLNYKMLSTGNLCRKHIAEQTPIGKEIQEYISGGMLIPDEMMMKMVEEWLTEAIQGAPAIILDGFPRTARQVDLLLHLLNSRFPDNLFRAVLLTLPDEEIVQRIAGRLVCENKKCQAVYSRSSATGDLCEKCGSLLIRRKDDEPEVVRERLRVYASHERQVVDALEKHDVAIKRLNVSGINPGQVFDLFKKEVVAALEKDN